METSGTGMNIDEALGGGNVKVALKVLNSTVPHRFTAIYEFRGKVLRSLYVVDKLDPLKEPFEDSLVDESYCGIVRDKNEPVKIQDAWTDPLAMDHIAFQKAKAYYGFPLRDREGRMLGTICHFDPNPQVISDAQWG